MLPCQVLGVDGYPGQGSVHLGRVASSYTRVHLPTPPVYTTDVTGPPVYTTDVTVPPARITWESSTRENNLGDAALGPG